MIHCQYVYGIGHFVRATELANGLSNIFEVYLFNGGDPVPNFVVPESVSIIQLPAIFKEENSEYLMPVDHSITLQECFHKRENIIHKAVKEIEPDILITEHFPFGLLFEAEVISLISKVKKANPNSKIVSSVRDVIESSAGGSKDEHICQLINRWYDMVLVHGDERFIALSSSFPEIVKINVPIFHTGYVVRPIPPASERKTLPTVLASVGGGRIGNELLDALIDSHQSIRGKRKHELILFSGAFEKLFNQQREKVSSLQSADISIHTFDSQNYLNCLSKASLIISLGGYNSIIESFSARKKMLIYQRKFAGANKEQEMRIRMFEKTGLLDVIKPEDLQAENLSRLIVDKIDNSNMTDFELNMNGVQNSTDYLSKLYHQQKKPL